MSSFMPSLITTVKCPEVPYCHVDLSSCPWYRTLSRFSDSQNSLTARLATAVSYPPTEVFLSETSVVENLRSPLNSARTHSYVRHRTNYSMLLLRQPYHDIDDSRRSVLELVESIFSPMATLPSVLELPPAVLSLALAYVSFRNMVWGLVYNLNFPRAGFLRAINYHIVSA
ncbi:hypothetical protein BV25DRAFT_1190985 [Artomyces pyxidatus]|uniref:Uncharacterized protein n=1 Tax=Artomyces pyxidatus TaxID=48021 RepID=A0ACB8SS24_9AGAM|nr:hypothetical protein BV25DRAFT_1190985 [Artomyces pyxidatus]